MVIGKRKEQREGEGGREGGCQGPDQVWEEIDAIGSHTHPFPSIPVLFLSLPDLGDLEEHYKGPLVYFDDYYDSWKHAWWQQL